MCLVLTKGSFHATKPKKRCFRYQVCWKMNTKSSIKWKRVFIGLQQKSLIKEKKFSCFYSTQNILAWMWFPAADNYGWKWWATWVRVTGTFYVHGLQGGPNNFKTCCWDKTSKALVLKQVKYKLQTFKKYTFTYLVGPYMI